MVSLPDELTSLKKIAVFRALQLGDLMCVIPAIRALKHAYPSAEITLIGMPWSESFVSRYAHYFSEFISFPGYPGLPEQPFDIKAFTTFINKVSGEKFDLLLQMHGNGSIINPLMAMMGARKIAGYREPGRYCPDERLFMNYPEGFPEIDRHLELMGFLGIASQGRHLEMPVFENEKRNFGMLSSELGLRPKKYVCVHPGARDTRRWWSPANFAQVADAIAEKGYRIVLTGTEIDRSTVNEVAAKMKSRPVDLTGKTELGTLALLIKNSKMLLSNDTGVSHIAAAMSTPSVVIFLASDPTRWAPLNRQLHHIILPQHAEIEYVLENAEIALSTEDN